MQQGNATLPCTREKEMLFLQIVTSNAAKETRVSNFLVPKEPTERMCNMSPAEICSLTCHFTCLCNQAFHVQPHSLIQVRMQTWMHTLNVVLLYSLLHLQSTCNKIPTKMRAHFTWPSTWQQTRLTLTACTRCHTPHHAYEHA